MNDISLILKLIKQPRILHFLDYSIEFLKNVVDLKLFFGLYGLRCCFFLFCHDLFSE